MVSITHLKETQYTVASGSNGRYPQLPAAVTDCSYAIRGIANTLCIPGGVPRRRLMSETTDGAAGITGSFSSDRQVNIDRE